MSEKKNDEEELHTVLLPSEEALKSKFDGNNCMLTVSAEEQEPICMAWISTTATTRIRRRAASSNNGRASRQYGIQQCQIYEQQSESSEIDNTNESKEQGDHAEKDSKCEIKHMSQNNANDNESEISKEQQPQRTNEGCFPSEIEENNHGILDINSNSKISAESSQFQELQQQPLTFIHTQDIFYKRKANQYSQSGAVAAASTGIHSTTAQEQINKVKQLLQGENTPANEDLLNFFKNYEVHNQDMFDLASLLRNPTTRLKKYKHGAYLGAIVNSQRYGQGIMLYGDGCIYEGDWQNDMKFGYGYELFSNGSSYNGGYINNKSEGVGVYMWSNGEIYDGQWVGGQKHGSGMWSTQRGDTYIGEWKRNRPDGYGVHTWINGDRYEGEFKLSLKHGEGQEHFANGDYFTGQYVNGKPEGIGEYKWNDGSSYSGQFRNGLRHGKGAWKRQNNNQKDKSWDSYEGEYENDKKCGQGKFIWSSGDQYNGEFFNDLRHGIGVMQFADGSIYEGEWELGKQSGHGTIKVEGKILAQGIFKNNKIMHKNDDEGEEGGGEVICEDNTPKRNSNTENLRNGRIMKVGAINKSDFKNQMTKKSPQLKDFARLSPISTKSALQMRNENIKEQEKVQVGISSHQANSNILILKNEKVGERLQRTRKQKNSSKELVDQQWQQQQSKVRNQITKPQEYQQKQQVQEVQQASLNEQGTTATSRLLFVNLIKDLHSPFAVHSQISQDSQLPRVFASRSYTLHKNSQPPIKGEDESNKDQQNQWLLTPNNAKIASNQSQKIQNENELPPDYLTNKSNQTSMHLDSSFSHVSRRANMNLNQKQLSRGRNLDSLTIEGQVNCSSNSSNATKSQETAWNSCGIISSDDASTSFSGMLKIPSASPYAQRLTPIHRTPNKKISATVFNKNQPQGGQQISENDNILKLCERISKPVNMLRRVKDGEQLNQGQEKEGVSKQEISKDNENNHLNHEYLDNQNKTFSKNFCISSSVPKCRRANTSKENAHKQGQTNADAGSEQVIAWRPAGLSVVDPLQRSKSTGKQRSLCHCKETAPRRESKMQQLSQQFDQQRNPAPSIIMFRQTNGSCFQKTDKNYDEKYFFPS